MPLRCFPHLGKVLAIWQDSCGQPSDTLQAWEGPLQDRVEGAVQRLSQYLTYLEIDGETFDVDTDYFWQSSAPFFADVAAQDPYFACAGPIGENVCGWEPGTPRPFASVGYVALLKPLPPGAHVIRLGAKSPDGSWLTDVTYALEVGHEH